MKRKMLIFSLLALLLLDLVYLTSHAKAAAVTTTIVTMSENTNKNISPNQNVQHVDEIVEKLLLALAENDYEKFSHYFNDKKSCTLSGSSFREDLSLESFAMMREEMIQKGGLFVSKKMITGDDSAKVVVRNDYIATFQKTNYIARIGIIATNKKEDQCAVEFWIIWFDASKINAINQITDEILTAVNENRYDIFAKYFTNELKVKFSEEEFSDLHKNITNELGVYYTKENTFFNNGYNVFFVNKGNNILSVSSNLFYEKAEKPIEFTIDAEVTDGNIKVKNMLFQWIPATILEQADILAEQALISLFYDNYETFTSYCDPKLKAKFSEVGFNKLRKAFDPYGKYLSKKYVGVNFLGTPLINGGNLGSPLETTAFLYKLSFQNQKEDLYLSMITTRNNGQMVIQSFFINFPAKYLGNLADK